MQNYSGSFVTPIVIIVLAAIAVVALGAWAVLGAECLTKEQARARHPGAWLYWHGSSRCWDNQRGGRQVYSSNRNPLQLGKPPIDGSGNQARHSGRPLIPEPSPTIFYPELIAGGGTTNDMLYPHTVASWSPITDFDSDPPPFLPWARVSAAFSR